MVHTAAICASFGSSGVVAFTRLCPGRRCDHPESLGSRAHRGALGSLARLPLGSFVIDGFTQSRRGGAYVHLGWLDSLARTLGEVRLTFVRPGGRWVLRGSFFHSLAPCRIISVHSCGGWIDPGSLRSQARARWLVGFIRVTHARSWGSLRSSVFKIGSLAHALRFRSLSRAIVLTRFTYTRPGVRWVSHGSGSSSVGGFTRSCLVGPGVPAGS